MLQDLRDLKDYFEANIYNPYINDEISKAETGIRFDDSFQFSITSNSVYFSGYVDLKFNDPLSTYISDFADSARANYLTMLDLLIKWNPYFDGKKNFADIAKRMDVWRIPVSLGNNYISYITVRGYGR